MNVQILNEIAALARKAPPPQVGAPVSGNAQLKALKGSPVHPPGNPAPPPFEAPPQSDQEPVTPDISSMARAASAYSAAVNHGLNLDEINAIQDLAGQIRPAIADFLNQPGLEQADNAEAMMVAHPEAVQDLQAGLEQAVVETFSAPALVDDGIVSPDVPHEQTPVAVASVEIPVSEERVTNGAKPNPAVPAIAASPALQNAQAREQANVDNPVTVEEPSETSSGDFMVGNLTVSPASPAVPDSNSRPSRVEEPVEVEGGPENSKGDFTGIATSPARVNPQPVEVAQVESPVSRPEVVSTNSQQTPANQSETVATTQQSTPVTAASPALQNAQASESANVETPVSRPEVVSTNSQQTSASQPVRVVAADQEAPVTAASPALQNAQASENTNVETPVSRPETFFTQSQEVTVSRPETVAGPQQGTPVTAASPALQNAQASESANVETPVSRPETFFTQSQEVTVSRPETVATTQQGTPVTAASPALQNAQASESANVETPVSGSDTAVPQHTPQSQPGTRVATDQEAPVAAPSTHGLRELISDSAPLNPENVRDVNALVNSVVKNEFTAEAKEIFSEPKVIRTVADLVDFILERLREIILTKQLQKQTQSEGESGIS
ncbi:MAG: hypothetical protein IIA63_08190 [Nitrospinae bacterium]|nr:hypothetical protein [Nitrospinota bacterium]